MLQLNNQTPFPAGIAVFPDVHGGDTIYVAVKGTFSIQEDLKIAPEQRPLTLADEYWGEPGKSSLKYASEIHPAKPSTDVVLVGEAHAPGKRLVEWLDVALVVADRKKIIRVFGDRRWDEGFFGLSISKPVPFAQMPLMYERAFGGAQEADPATDQGACEPRNPLGLGFMGKRSHKEMNGRPLPNIEDPNHLIRSPGDQPPPAGFGPIAPSWMPRVSFAGTYDEAWQRQRAPYLPVDFNPRFLNVAHPDLVCPGYLLGGEPVEVVNASPRGNLRFHLPKVDLAVGGWMAGKRETLEPRLETVLLEPSVPRVTLLWRAAFPCDKRVLRVEEIEVSLRKVELRGAA